MAEPIMTTKMKHSTAVLIATILFVVIAPICFCWSWWNQSPDFVWALFRDSREYPHTDDPLHITKGDGDLEEDLLPHFLVKLPCDVQHLRYGEWEDYGPMGWLYLRFGTSPQCLNDFLRDNALHPTENSNFPPQAVPEEYGWRIEVTNSTYVGQPSTRVRLSVSIDQRSTRPTVFVISEYD
jgi:hypothetical protein